MATSDEPQVKKKIPFKLCFINKRSLGRSYVQTNRPLKLEIPLAPKLHTKKDAFSTENLDQVINRLKVIELREKYPHPITENQRYGWYNLKTVRPKLLDRSKCTQQIIKENLMNFEKIR